MANPTPLYVGRYLGLYERDGWEYVSRSNARAVVVLVARTANDELLLVEQYRPPLGQRVIELPAGLVGDQDDQHESLLDAAERELLEETGYRALSFEHLMTCPSTAGMSDEMISFMLARGLSLEGPGGGDDSEDIELHKVPMEKADQWLADKLQSGLALDPKIYTALYWLK